MNKIKKEKFNKLILIAHKKEEELKNNYNVMKNKLWRKNIKQNILILMLKED